MSECATTAHAELNYTDFGGRQTFHELLDSHSLVFAGECSDCSPGATNFKWESTDGLQLWTASRPDSSQFKPGSDRDDEMGYASYVFIRGPLPAIRTLYRDVIERASYIKGEFQPLQTTESVLLTMAEVQQR